MIRLLSTLAALSITTAAHATPPVFHRGDRAAYSDRYCRGEVPHAQLTRCLASRGWVIGTFGLGNGFIVARVIWDDLTDTQVLTVTLAKVVEEK